MAKMDELKEDILLMSRLMTMFIGAIILTVGGISSLYLVGERSEIYWLGIFSVAVLVVVCLYLVFRVRQQIQRLGRL